MTDITVTHRIEAPELAAALNNLAGAIKSRSVAVPVAQNGSQSAHGSNDTPAQKKPVQAEETPTTGNPTLPVQTVPATAASITPTVSNTAVQNNVPTGVAQTVPVAPVTPAVPTAAVPTPAAETPATTAKVYTFDDLAAAGSQLLESGRMNDLMALLNSYGVQALTALKPEQYADIAAGLRGLGAKI